MKVTIYLSLLAIIVYSVVAKPMDDDYDPTFGADDLDMQKDDYLGEDYDDSISEDEDDGAVPQIVTKPQTLRVKPDSEVLLPCEFEGDIDSYVIMWQKQEHIIFQDKIPLGNFSASKYVLKNRSLLIKQVSESDGGDYTCKILVNSNPPKVTHHLIVESPAKITFIGADRNLGEYKAGDTLQLTCNATGEPAPKLVWSFKGRRVAEGSTIIMENIGHAQVGHYQCLAQNGIGEPSHQSIEVKIKHKPIVSFEKIVSSITEESFDVELKCTVNSMPKSIVTWKKDGETIPEGVLKLRQKNGVHSTKITHVKESDFGTYSCKAENEIGKTEQYVLLTNAPAQPKKKSQSRSAKEITFIWEVESLSPISEHVVMYKKKNEDKWVEEKAEVTNAAGYMFELKHAITNIENGEYEVKAKSRNAHGWSEESKIETFRVQNKSHHGHKKQHHKEEEHNMTEMHHEHVEEPRSATASAATITAPSVLAIFSILALLFTRH